MFSCIIILVLISSIYTAPITDEKDAKTLMFENTIDEKGNYEFSYETSNGIYRSESGKQVKDKDTDEEHLLVIGFFTYTDPDGNTHEIRYQGDENGFVILPPFQKPVSQNLPSSVVASLLG